jgi:hypothetical protein
MSPANHGLRLENKLTAVSAQDHCKHGHRPEDEAVQHHECDITISFNGVKRDFNFRPHELIRKLLDQAIKEFGIAQNPHTYSLFDATGVELNDTETLHNAGVRCEDILLLRASTVKAGAC